MVTRSRVRSTAIAELGQYRQVKADLQVPKCDQELQGEEGSEQGPLADTDSAVDPQTKDQIQPSSLNNVYADAGHGSTSSKTWCQTCRR